ncbi:MAG: methyltransferase domain-containing protein [bacterium]|nr:methyltransferase domain-containing protein [bacterium]
MGITENMAITEDIQPAESQNGNLSGPDNNHFHSEKPTNSSEILSATKDSLRTGNVVVLLNCSDEQNVLNASKCVGKTGFVIGLARDNQGLKKAQRAARFGYNGSPCSNVEFIESSESALPIHDSSIDVVILDKTVSTDNLHIPQLEIDRILKPGGKILMLS